MDRETAKIIAHVDAIGPAELNALRAWVREQSPDVESITKADTIIQNAMRESSLYQYVEDHVAYITTPGADPR